jgi:thiamine-monophosphate kinase
MGEFELIERIRARVDMDDSVVVGIGDDAAVLRSDPDRELVVTTDSIVANRHFEAHWLPAEIGHLALAVNLSDLAAMGARPRWVLLSLTLPESDPHWLDEFLDGFLALAEIHQTRLVGGNLSSGPLNVTVQLIGDVETGAAVLRSGARPGDIVAVTGTLGDAAAAFKLGASAPETLVGRFRRPSPQVAAGAGLASRARAMIDISDGLIADLAHLLGADLSARVELDRLPASDALCRVFADDEDRWRLQATGGNDYELLVILPEQDFEAARGSLDDLGVALTRIGRIEAGQGIQCRRPDGTLLEFEHGGWDHFNSR